MDLDSLGTDARDVVESGGLLWVLTDHEPFVTVLDSAGRVAERFGARGRGPRDLLAPWSIVAGPRDEVPWIYDAGKHAMLQLPRRALDARSVAIRTVLGFVRADFREITYGEIAAVFRSSTGFIAPVYRGDGTVTRSLLFPALVSYSETGEPLDTLVDFLKAPPDTSGISGALDLVPIPLFAGCGTDTVYMYDGYSDGIERVTRTGDRVRIADVPASLLEWRVPTREDRVRYVRRILEAEYEGAPSPPDLDARAERLASNDVTRFTPRLPRFTRLRCGPNGSLLLQGFDLADNRVGYGSDWYVYTGSKALSRATLPDRFEPRAVRGDTLLGLLFDEDGRASVALAVQAGLTGSSVALRGTRPKIRPLAATDIRPSR